MALSVEVDCSVPSVVQVNASVTQFAGFDLVHGGGFGQDVACDGLTRIDIPIEDQRGEIAGGPAHATVQVWTFDDISGFFDFAAETVTVVLRGHSAPTPFGPPPPDPDSTITIGSYGDSTLHGTIRCPAGVHAFVGVDVIQEHGRTTERATGFGDLTCTGGDDAFAVSILDDGLRKGRAQAVVEGFAFESGPGGEIVVIYQDLQSGEIRLP